MIWANRLLVVIPYNPWWFLWRRVCTTGCAHAEEEHQEAGIRLGRLHGQEGSTVEGKTGQGLSPFSSRSESLVATPEPRHVWACVCTHRGQQGWEGGSSLGIDLAAVNSESGALGSLRQKYSPWFWLGDLAVGCLDWVQFIWIQVWATC